LSGALALLAAIALLVPAQNGRKDLRSQEIVRMDCASDLGDQGVTLFGNGTIRLRRRSAAEERLWLGELDPGETRAYENRLREIDLAEAESPHSGASGQWVEQCRLHLSLPGAPERSFRFGRYDSLGLALSHVVQIVDELEREARARDARHGLPAGYEPQPDDILIDDAGARFRVVRLTADGGGVELLEDESPLLIYLAVDQLRERFVALEREPAYQP
jgi:hypothetical protein